MELERGKETIGGKQTTFELASTCYLIYLHNFDNLVPLT